jgi:tripartite-type tricarboxylate transporter receptor subunit TctC
MVIAAHPTFPGNSISDIVATAKGSAKGVDIAMPSTTARIVFELLKAQSKATIVGIPYKGSATAMTEAIGGQVPIVIDTVTAVRPHLAAGKLKPIAVTSQKATTLLPDVKPVAEQGLPGFEVIAWNALYAPSGTPKEIVNRLNAEINRILTDPEARQKMKDLGFDVVGGSPEQLAEFAQSERRKWGPLIKNAGIRAE